MRLVRALERLESALANRKRRAVRIGICFTADDVLLDREALAPGDAIAVDLHVHNREGLYLRVRSVERIAANAEDFGAVYDATGNEVIGRVVSVEGAFVNIEWSDVGGVQPYRARVVGAAREGARRAGR